MYIDKDFIKDLCKGISLKDLVREEGFKIDRGGKVLCPFHSDRNPSCHIYENRFYCFSCNQGGDAVSFLMQVKGLNFLGAVDYLAAREGVAVPTKQRKLSYRELDLKILEEVSEIFKGHAEKSLVFEKFLIDRGIDSEVANFFDLGYAPNGQILAGLLDDSSVLSDGSVFKNTDKGILRDRLDKLGLVRNSRDFFWDRIIFPITDSGGRVIGFSGRDVKNRDRPKYLNSRESYIFNKGKVIYNFKNAFNSKLDSIIVCEGYMDVISLYQSGFKNAVGVMGTAINSEQIRILNKVNKLTFCFDGDLAGKKASLRALENLLPLVDGGVEYNFLFLPEGEDPDSFVRSRGGENFAKYLGKESKGCISYLWDHCEEGKDLNNLDDSSAFLHDLKDVLKSASEHCLGIVNARLQRIGLNKIDKVEEFKARDKRVENRERIAEVVEKGEEKLDYWLRGLFGIEKFFKENPAFLKESDIFCLDYKANNEHLNRVLSELEDCYNDRNHLHYDKDLLPEATDCMMRLEQMIVKDSLKGRFDKVKKNPKNPEYLELRAFFSRDGEFVRNTMTRDLNLELRYTEKLKRRMLDNPDD